MPPPRPLAEGAHSWRTPSGEHTFKIRSGVKAEVLNRSVNIFEVCRAEGPGDQSPDRDRFEFQEHAVASRLWQETVSPRHVRSALETAKDEQVKTTPADSLSAASGEP